MTGSKLHQFDLSLCEYVLGNLSGRLDRADFASYVEETLDPAVLAYARALGDEDDPPPLLLSASELDVLAEEIGGGPLELDRPWVPYEALHRRSAECLPEIRAALAGEVAEQWARDSAQCTTRLEARGVRLSRGIEITAEWVAEARRLLRAMGATEFLPRPEGKFPTPSAPAPCEPEPAADEVALEVMRRLIADLGPDTAAKVLVQRCGIRQQRARNALRRLKDLGEFRGFTRERPSRYRADPPDAR